MASSSGDGFPTPSRETEAEWRLLLTAVAGPFRNLYGEGPALTPAVTGTPIMVADNRGKTQPMFVTVQVSVPGIVVFGRANNPTILNGFQHNFAVDLTFQQILMPGDRLFATVLGAATSFVVTSTVL